MSSIGPGFDALRERCERRAIRVTLGPSRGEVPAHILHVPQERTLLALYHEHDGIWWSAPEFSLRIYPLDMLERENRSLRRTADDYRSPYPFTGLLAFAQYGHQATYLATIASLDDRAGGQPVLYLDTHEDPWAVPIASSVDAAFALIARYVDHATGELGLGGFAEIGFPFDVPELISADAKLSALVAGNVVEPWIRGDASIQEWMRRTFERV